MLTISLFVLFTYITANGIRYFGSLLLTRIYVKLLLLLARVWVSSVPIGGSEFPASLPALLLMVCLAIVGAYQSSQGNSSENDPNNTTVSGPFFLTKET